MPPDITAKRSRWTYKLIRYSCDREAFIITGLTDWKENN